MLATVLLTLSTAAGTQAPPDWTTALRATEVDPADVRYPYTLTPAMEAFAEDAVRACRGSGKRRLHCLRNALFRRGFAYDPDVFDAAEAFEQGTGNCFAFTVLFAAMARHIGIDATVAKARRDSPAKREGDLVLVRSHVVAMWQNGPQLYVFDFQAELEEPVLVTPLDELQVAALAHASRGTAALRRGQADVATRELELTVRLDPAWPGGWIDLAVAHGRAGRPEAELRALREALRLDPTHPSALANLAARYDEVGRSDLHLLTLRAAADGRPTAYALVALALAELSAGDPTAARRVARRARWLRPGTPEALDALALIADADGDVDRVRRYRERAEKLRARTPRS